MFKKAILLLGLLCIWSAGISQGHKLEVHISGIQDKGTVHVQLFAEGQKLKANSGECLKKSVRIPKEEKGSVLFEDLSTAHYAIMIYHDENNNGKLDTNILGIPQEAGGSSNNVKGIPTFKKCKFLMNSSRSMEIELVYFQAP